MLDGLIYSMVYLGSALMVYNIYAFMRFVRYIQSLDQWGKEGRILYVPTILLVFFLIGYLVVGVFGKPDFVIAGILFGGSIFVYIMYRFFDRVTKRIVENERLEAELLAAEKSSQAKTTFLASVSHEMRTPINIILGIDHIALQNPDISETTRVQLEKIGLSTQHLLGLINNILDINRTESGDFTIKSERFLLRGIVAQIDALVETLCEEKGLEYRPAMDDELPDAFMGDEVMLKQVLLSMLDNAVKFTDSPGTVSFLVEAASDCEPSSVDDAQGVRFVISDTGVGMDEEFIPKLFDVFEQEDASYASRHGGSGLSLALAKNIVDRMGGSIEVTSKKGEGSTFTVVVPLELGVQDELPAKSEPAEEQVSLEGRRVLVVEDIEENAEIVIDLLDLEGVECEHAENGQIAVDMFAQSDSGYYDAVLMDLRMPVMDGLEATRQIRGLSHSDAKTVPIIALTANAYESDVNHALDAGMNAHLAKPADVDLLYATLKKYMR